MHDHEQILKELQHFTAYSLVSNIHKKRQGGQYPAALTFPQFGACQRFIPTFEEM